MSLVTKNDALKEYDKNLKKNIKLYLFQEDIKSKPSAKTGRKQFLVKSIKDIYIKTCENKDSHFYEFWQKDTPLKFALDIDLPKENLTYEKSQELLKKAITDVLYFAEQFYEHIYNISDVIVLETIPQETSQKKYSYHVIFNNLMFASHLVCKDFFRRMKKEVALEGCDESIYNLTCLRIMGSSKIGENRVLVPMEYRIDGKTTSIGKDLDFFKKTLITYTDDINGDNFVDESFMETKYEELIDDDKEILSDINNIDIEKILNGLPMEVCDQYHPWIRVGMILCNTSKKSGINLLDLFNKWSSKSKKYKGIDDVHKHWKTLESSKKNQKLSIGSLIHDAKRYGIDGFFKNDKKSVDVVVGEYPKKEIQLTPKKNTIIMNQRYLTPELYKKFYDSGSTKLLAVQSEKGTGKTSNLIESYFKNGLIVDDMNILLISSRRTFGAKLLGDLNKYGFKLYSDFDDQYINHNRIICQFDSLLRLDRTKYHTIIIDECESLARYMTSQHFTKNNKASMVINMFESYLSSADNVYILDADLSDRCVNYYQKVMNLGDEEVSMVVNNFQLYTEYDVKYMKFNDWLNQIINDIDLNKKIVIPMASNNKAKDLKCILEERYPNKKILFLNRDVNDVEKINIVMNVDETWSRYDIVIYTPSVCMGVSFDKKDYFDSIYAYGCEESLGAQEFCQMIHRVRHPQNKVIFLAFDKYEEFKEDNKITYGQTEELICNDYYLTHYNVHTNIVPHKIRKIDDYLKFIDQNTNVIEYGEDKQIEKPVEPTSQRNERVIFYPYKNEPIYELYVRNTIETIENKNNFCWAVFGYLKHKGYKLSYLKLNDTIEFSKVLKEQKKQRTENEKENYLDKIIDTPDIKDEEYKEISSKKDEVITDEERMKVKRYKFKKCYDIENLGEDKEKIRSLFDQYDDSTKKKHYSHLKRILSTETQKTEDKLKLMKANIVNDSYRKNAYTDLITKNTYTAYNFSLEFIEMLGFNINDLSKSISSDVIGLNVVNIKECFNDEYNNICYKFGCKIRHKSFVELDEKEAFHFIKKIIKIQYGLEIKKTKNDEYIMNVYVDDNGSVWNKLYEYKKNKVVTDESLNKLIEPVNITDKLEIDDGFIED